MNSKLRMPLTPGNHPVRRPGEIVGNCRDVRIRHFHASVERYLGRAGRGGG